MLKGREGMLKGRGGDVEGRMLKGMGVLMGRGMEKEWFRRCPVLASRRPPASLSYAVVAS